MDIIKTIEGWRDRERVMAFLKMHDRNDPDRVLFYFTVGRGRPKREVERLWFTHKGEVLGCFIIKGFEMYAGDMQDLIDRLMVGGRTLDSATGPRPSVQEFNETVPGKLSGKKPYWRPKPGTWLCFVRPPFQVLPDVDRFYFKGFRGFRYFDLKEHRIPEGMP